MTNAVANRKSPDYQPISKPSVASCKWPASSTLLDKPGFSRLRVAASVASTRSGSQTEVRHSWRAVPDLYSSKA